MRCLFNDPSVVLVDLSNVVARAKHVQDKAPIDLFLRMLLKLRRDFDHHRFVFALEGRGATRRQAIDQDYKQGRMVDDSFNSLRADATRLLEHTRYTLVQAPEGEADDAIAAYIKHHCKRSHVVIVSEDRDLWQLITDRVQVQATVRGTVTMIDKWICKQALGVPPGVVPLYKTLLGDKSDNIPRAVARMKTELLLRLAQEATGATADVVTYACCVDWLSDAQKERIRKSRQRIETNARLVTLWPDLALDIRDGQPSGAGFREALAAHQTELTDNEIQLLVGERT